jgi:flagellar biosynthetic protein FlhB
MPAEKDDKTEPATPRKREEVREKGQVAKSREVTSVAVLIAAVVYCYFFTGITGDVLSRATRHFFQGASVRMESQEDLFSLLVVALEAAAWALAPLLGFVVIFSVLAHVIQFGLLFAPEALMPKMNRINPMEGLKRLVGKQGLMDLFKSLGKIALVGYVGYLTVAEAWPDLPKLSQMPPAAILAFLLTFGTKIILRSTLVLIFLAAVDYAFQRYSFEQNIKMSKDEVKQEYKQREGDPLVKARVRQVQREISRRRMMAAVPKADVVITNPTHYAVAILYVRGEMEAPMVVAKGRGFIAQRIREVAEENDVPLVENKPLARGLYRAVQIGQAIPAEFYKAVAEILAYVYTLKREAA